MRDGTHVAVSVTDEGRGVSPERLPHLFGKYTATAEGERGGGLALAICKGLVEAHGGRRPADLALRARRVSVGGRAVDLTATEYELLRLLSLSAGRVVTFDSLIRRVWRERGHGNRKLLRAFIKNVRSKLGDDAGEPTYIFTRRGVGYRMGDPDGA